MFNFYFHKTGFLSKLIYPNVIWSLSAKEPTIYLTFDDGPIPEVTPFVLDELNKVSAKATFFCVGDNISKYPEVFDSILATGHQVGNHTYNHLNGFKVSNDLYISNVEKCSDLMRPKLTENDTRLFRPPYGRLRKEQLKYLNHHYAIIMWDVLSGDFDLKLSPEKCLEKSIANTQNGSIVIFHDSIKAEKKLRYVLPRYLEHFSILGYKFEKIVL